MSRRPLYPVGLENFVREVDDLVARGALKPIWARAVRKDAFRDLVAGVFKAEADVRRKL